MAIVAGIPLGVSTGVGNWTWNAFANSIGFVAVPDFAGAVAPLAGGLAIVLLAGNLLAAGPAYLAARIRPAATFRTE